MRGQVARRIAEIIGVLGTLVGTACVAMFGLASRDTALWPKIFYLDAALMQLLPMLGGFWFSFQFAHQRQPMRAFVAWCCASAPLLVLGGLAVARAFYEAGSVSTI